MNSCISGLKLILIKMHWIFYFKTSLLGQEDDPVDKGTWQGQKPEFSPWNSEGRRELTPERWHLTTKCMPRHADTQKELVCKCFDSAIDSGAAYRQELTRTDELPFFVFILFYFFIFLNFVFLIVSNMHIFRSNQPYFPILFSSFSRWTSGTTFVVTVVYLFLRNAACVFTGTGPSPGAWVSLSVLKSGSQWLSMASEQVVELQEPLSHPFWALT